MSSPAVLKMLRQTLYSLKRQYGTKITYHSLIASSVDRKTGAKTTSSNPTVIQRGIVLPIEIAQSLLKNTGSTSEDKTLPKSGGFLHGDGVFMIDGRDINILPKQGDWIVYDNQQFDVTKIHRFCESAAYILETRSQSTT